MHKNFNCSPTITGVCLYHRYVYMMSVNLILSELTRMFSYCLLSMITNTMQVKIQFISGL